MHAKSCRDSSRISSFIALVCFLFSASSAQAQFTGFSVELVQEHDAVIPSLEGLSTYRVYAECTNETDFVSAIFGDAEAPLSIASPTGFWQSYVGADFGSEVNPGLFAAIPDLEFDSWLTLGAEAIVQAGSGVAEVGMTAALSNFNSFGNLVLDSPNGGSWFVMWGNPIALAGEDLRVLLAQLTVQSSFEGVFNIQVFIDGNQANEEQSMQRCFNSLGSNTCAFVGCTDPENCNYDPEATELDPDSCFDDLDNDGVCDEFEIDGCTIVLACNYDSTATEDDGSCVFYCPGCTNSQACNYEESALQEDGSCVFPVDLFGFDYLDCAGECVNDDDGDGICDELEVLGCMNPLACDYNAEATDSSDCEFESCAGCIYEYACNYDSNAVFYDGSCEFGNCSGCTNPLACNFNPTVVDDDGTCEFLDECGVCGGGGAVEGFYCDGTCNDMNENGLCDVEESGCTDAEACNFNPVTFTDDGSCTYPEACSDCIGECLDENSNLICDCDEFPGCTNSGACNFDSVANVDDGTCQFSTEFIDCDGNCLSDADFDGICDDIDSCPSDPLNDDDGDGVCGNLEIEGCTDPEACNFDLDATDDNGSCIVIEILVSEYYDLGWEEGYDQGYVHVISDLELFLHQGVYCGAGTYWDSDSNACVPMDCIGDFNGDGLRGSADLIDFLSVYDTSCPIAAPTFSCGDVVTFDGDEYNTISIGDQCWFAENLRSTRFANDESILGDLNELEWSEASTGAYSENDEGLSFGHLFNGYSVIDPRGVCPIDWHVPTVDDWMQLVAHLGGTEVASTVMRASAQDIPAWDGSNTSFFSAFPGGLRDENGVFLFGQVQGFWWIVNDEDSWIGLLNLNSLDPMVHTVAGQFRTGASVRCTRNGNP